MRTQVGIVGGGPSGLLLSLLLDKNGIDSVVLERQTRAHVLARVRAGVLESGLVELMAAAGVAERLKRECFIHEGISIAHNGTLFRVDFKKCTGKSVTVYGQTEVTRDLYDAHDRTGRAKYFGVSDAGICDADTERPHISYILDGSEQRLDCDFVAGCDGFHGVSRKTIPGAVRREYEKVFPFGWLGILSETPPVNHELVYANSARGFALCSMRNAGLSRYYIQCDLSASPAQWSDDDFWRELQSRLPDEISDRLETGPSIEKSIAPLRSFVSEPMQWGRLYLCGDAAHIVPPTGAKGLNTAACDVNYLFRALVDYYASADTRGLAGYSDLALARVWKAERFSWYATELLHRFPNRSAFDQKMQTAELDLLRQSEASQTVFSENYVGLPY